jgi:transposase-like protein
MNDFQIICPDCGSSKVEYLGMTAIEDGETILMEPHFQCLSCGCDFTTPDESD